MIEDSKTIEIKVLKRDLQDARARINTLTETNTKQDAEIRVLASTVASLGHPEVAAEIRRLQERILELQEANNAEVARRRAAEEKHEWLIRYYSTTHESLMKSWGEMETALAKAREAQKRSADMSPASRPGGRTGMTGPTADS